MGAKEETAKLADFILKNYPEYVIDGCGAGDAAINIIKDLEKKVQTKNVHIERVETVVLNVT